MGDNNAVLSPERAIHAMPRFVSPFQIDSCAPGRRFAASLCPGLTCFGPFGAKVWLHLLNGEAAIVVMVDDNAPTAGDRYSFRPEGAFT
jgi:hypothetical protein